MKKLMIAACAVALAAVAQAAQVNWTATYCFKPGTSDFATGYVAYMFAAEDYAFATAKEDFAAGKFDNLTLAIGAPKNADGTGSFAAGSYADKDAGTYNFYMVIFNAGTADDADKFFALGGKPGTLKDGDGNETTIAFGMVTSTMLAESWTDISSAPVPEPTTGLLLLLGMAGLALKRKLA